jgi:hypothetical protein
MTATIYKLTNANKEAHFPKGNNSVAVCWNIHKALKSLKGEDGLVYKAEVWERAKDSKPYIDFVSVREYEKEEFVESEDSPVDGGLSIDFAQSIADELYRAIKYVAFLKKEK